MSEGNRVQGLAVPPYASTFDPGSARSLNLEGKCYVRSSLVVLFFACSEFISFSYSWLREFIDEPNCGYIVLLKFLNHIQQCVSGTSTPNGTPKKKMEILSKDSVSDWKSEVLPSIDIV